MLETHLKWKIENITVPQPPLLKIYYWEMFDITGLNRKLLSGHNMTTHDFHIPITQINSKPLKVIFWLRNCTTETIELKFKRIRNCQCQLTETRVGFNQFRQMYHCPHRRLLNILQEHFRMPSEQMVALTVTAHFFLFGEHKLTYEIRCSDSRIITVNFFLDIVGFAPEKCLLTKELLPVKIKESRRFVQAIWVWNITMQQLNFFFSTQESSLKIINPTLQIPKQSIWPLIVEFRPTQQWQELELQMTCDCGRANYLIGARGVLEVGSEFDNVPIKDYECASFPYVVYPNRLDFNIEQQEERTQMVAVHNYDKKCVEFCWQAYVINGSFKISFEPSTFRLKPNHTKLCVVSIRSQKRALHFQRIPAVLEVHRIFDKATRIAKELLAEVESIDDPKWKQDSYLEHVFLHINLKVNMPEEESLMVTKECMSYTTQRSTTIFEQLFWDYLSKSNFERENKNPKISELLGYKRVLNLCLEPEPEPEKPKVQRNDLQNILSQVLAEGVRDLAKNWAFVPLEMCSS